MTRFVSGVGTYGEPKFVGKSGRCFAGNYCSFASNVTILTVGHRVSRVTTFPFDAKERFIADKYANFVSPREPSSAHPVWYGDVVIRNDVWIGYGATILGGVTIGNGAVIAANAIVRSSVPPYAIVVGNPGIVSHYRFSQTVINKLEIIQWWNWEEHVIKQRVDDLIDTDVTQFVNKYIQEAVDNGNKNTLSVQKHGIQGSSDSFGPDVRSTHLRRTRR